MAENSPLTFRADEETKAKFAQIFDQFANKGAALQALIGAYELETAKGTLAGSADLIEDFRAHLDCISRAYIAQLDLNANAEQRIRTELSEELAGLARHSIRRRSRRKQPIRRSRKRLRNWTK